MRSMQLWFVIPLVCCATNAHAEALECTVKSHFETTDDGLLAASAKSGFIGSVFRVDVDTGEITGTRGGAALDNQNVPGRTVAIVNPDRPGNSVVIVTTRGGALGYLADMLLIRTWVEHREKPFDLYSGNFGFFTGTCVRI